MYQNQQVPVDQRYTLEKGDVVGMLIPLNEKKNLHNPLELADYITSFCLAALGKQAPLFGEVSQK